MYVNKRVKPSIFFFFCKEISAKVGMKFLKKFFSLLTFSRRKFEITPPIGSPPRENCISTYLPLENKINK
jgi:hypothetical protein